MELNWIAINGMLGLSDERSYPNTLSRDGYSFGVERWITKDMICWIRCICL